MRGSYDIKAITTIRRGLVVVLAVISLGFMFTSAGLIYLKHENSLQEAGRKMQDMSTLLTQEADATLTLASILLEELKADLFLETEKPADPFVIHQSFTNHRQFINQNTRAPSFAHFLVLDAEGFNVANSVAFPIKKIDASDRTYFIHHKNNNDNALYISQPRYSKVTGERVIFLTKRLTGKDGAFKGVIGVQLKLSHFDRIYRAINLPPGGTVTILRKDGWGIYRFPLIEAFFERSISDAPPFQKMLKQKRGFFRFPTTPYDGVARVAGYHASQDYPILNVITITEETALQGWRSESLELILFTGAGLLVLFVLGGFSYRHLQHLSNALNLSSHDPLTELANRRALNLQLDEEWRRAERKGSRVSLLFIDIDDFKRYNDLYGHRAGDKCLKQIADALAGCALRAGELVAWFGGEEFIILLPSIEANEAHAVAETALRKVRQLHIPHADAQASSIVTISIGFATTLADRKQHPTHLIDAADQALYQAKDLGKDQVYPARWVDEPNDAEQKAAS